jgi:Mg2+-importing ATPase
MITKGALSAVLAVCTSAKTGDRDCDLGTAQDHINQHYEELSRQGLRVLGVAIRDIGDKTDITKDDEAGMTFAGFLVLYDPLKAGIRDVLADFKSLGIQLKVITGDNALVAASVCQELGIENPVIVTGAQMRQMSDEAMLNQVVKTDVFAEVEPNQKQRIILALRKSSHVVGFMGDGINDAPALHAADVSISVNTGVDVAKDAADIVLLDSDLRTLIQGVRGGRTTIANTLKYMFMATSANFGNMFSMAGASLFLPFLPLLPKQILLTNLLTDFPEMTISTDSTDPEMVEKPTRWNIDFIRKFMLVFGPLSSVFDYATFAVLLWVLHATPEQFRSGWFMESVISAALIVLVVRTRRPFVKSRPSKWLLGATLAVVAGTFLFPYTALAPLFGFVPLPPKFIAMMFLIVVAYIGSAELAKAWFYRKVKL